MNFQTLSRRIPFRTLACLVAAWAGSGVAQALDNSNKAASPTAVSTQAHVGSFSFLDGSTTAHREEIDGTLGNVYIYTGAGLPAGTTFGQMRFVFDQGNSTGYITPLLFQQLSPNIYTVVGVGKGFTVAQSPFTQSIPFVLIEGIRTPYNTTFTFGFINALVGARGLPLATSAGTVDYDPFEDGGLGLRGFGSTNAWNATSQAGVTVPLGATFGPSGSGALYPLINGFRTYSALVTGIAP